MRLVVVLGGGGLPPLPATFACETASADAAVARLPHSDALVTDDLALLSRVRDLGHRIPVLAIVQPADCARAFTLGATDFAVTGATAEAIAARLGVLAARAELATRALFPELNPTAVMRLSAGAAIEYANPAAHALAHALGVPLARLLPEDTDAITRDVLDNDHASPVIETRRGGRTLSWTFHPLVAHQTVHCYASDITERLQLEEQLRQSQKMDAVGHLAGGIAHDFNNLLTVIYANTMMLQRTQQSKSLTAIATASERAADLVRQLLAFSRQQVLEKRDLELNTTVANMLKLLVRVLREDIRVELDLAPHMVWARADAGMLDQVIMNLVVNARDAMPEGGALTLSTSVFVLDEEDQKAMPDLAPGAYARLRVTDTGTGIPPSQLPLIFDPFFTTKEVGKGTGLGLATVFGIVKQHAGAIAVTSEVGRGTTFSVLLPAARETQFAEEPPGASEPVAPRGGSEAILVVEDEAAVRQLVEEVLEASGYRVRALATGAEAIAALETGPIPDLVLTDLVMPGGVSGAELAARVRTAHPSVRIVYTSGHAAGVAPELPLRAGVNFLPKPFGPAALLACVRACLDERS